MNKKLLQLLVISTIILLTVSCSLPLGKKEVATESGEQSISPPKNTEVVITLSPTEQENLPFFDEFNDNKNGWMIGENPSDNSDLTAEIKDGLYQWTVYSHGNSNWSIWPDIDQVRDFTFMVDLRQKSKNFDDCDIGMIYRDPSNGTMVTITLSNKRHSAFLFTENEGWSELSAWDSNNAIAPGLFNQLKVTRAGDLYEFFVNDQKISEFTLSEIEKGQLGLSTDVFSADKTCEYEFDNFRVTSP